ncbi:MAG: hypothetical protein QM760_08525 [Nibricoccus sp.]
MLPSTSLPSIKIVALEPLVKLANGQNYRIRIVQDKRSNEPLHAVAALRCENREEIHWLSAGLSSPVETARLMRNGFKLLQGAEDNLAYGVAQELVRNGCAVGLDA